MISCIMDLEETGETDTNKERKSVVGVSGPRPPMIDESTMPIGREILQDFLATAAQLGDRREDYCRICPSPIIAEALPCGKLSVLALPTLPQGSRQCV